jgi:WhiB family transcriptional regulator, redox-sensing transcriptional regulator
VTPRVVYPRAEGPDEVTWMAHAACRDLPTDLFFVGDGTSGLSPGDMNQIAKAKAVCGGCEVREPCLEYALRHRFVYGVWGGLAEAERRRLKRARRAS